MVQPPVLFFRKHACDLDCAKVELDLFALLSQIGDNDQRAAQIELYLWTVRVLLQVEIFPKVIAKILLS